MKKLVLLLITVILLSSCDQVIFTEPQPARVKAMTQIPETLQGVWLDDSNDTLYVGTKSFRYPSEDFSITEPEFLSDTSVLKEYKGRYFLNRTIRLDEGNFWLSYMIDPVEPGKKMDLYTMDPDDVVKLAKLQEITSKIRDIEEGETSYYLFSPKKKHYKKIISDTIFSKMISFRKLK